VRIRRSDLARRTSARETRGLRRSAVSARRSSSAPSPVYEPADHLKWPCTSCGGAKLPLRRRDGSDGTVVSDLLLRLTIDDHECPGCETRRRRLEACGDEPAVWYDTLVCDWVVRLPLREPANAALLPIGEPANAALLPLEIHWFDAPWAEVYRAAADVAFGGDRLKDTAAFERRRIGGE
jgi:hypothetical protein